MKWLVVCGLLAAVISAAPISQQAKTDVNATTTATNATNGAPETQADAAKDGTAPLACKFMKCPADRPYCQMGSCVDKATAEKGGGASGGFNYSQFMGDKGDKTGSPSGGFNYSQFMGGKGDKTGSPSGGFNYCKFMGGKGADKSGKGFDFSKFMGGKGGDKSGKGFDFSKYMGGASAPSTPAPVAQATMEDLRSAKTALDAGLISSADYTKVKNDYLAGLHHGDKASTSTTSQPQAGAGFSSNAAYLKSVGMT